jgi:hypothetical protein
LDGKTVTDFYPAKNNDDLNTRPFQPESVAGRVMVNPRYPIRRLAKVAPWWCERCGLFHTFPKVRCDSGAFQDIGTRSGRLFPWQALGAQLRLEEQLRWWLDEPTFHFEVVFIYDDPAGVDEAIVGGKKVKVRGDEASAAVAIENTLTAARYYASRRKDIQARIGWVGQGIDAEQYCACVEAMLPWMQPADVFAFGGFCILGRMPKKRRKDGLTMFETYQETLERVAPLVRGATGIDQFHLLGVMYPPGVTWASQLATDMECFFATDGSGPEQAACISGAVYRDDGTQNHGVYTKAQKYKEYHPCDLALSNIATYSTWASGL